jgi:Negative regulator of sigma E activity
MKWILMAAWLALIAPAHAAGNMTASQWSDWLNRVAQAAEQLNYSGTFVYQHGSNVDVSRVAHRADGSDEMGKNRGAVRFAARICQHQRSGILLRAGR